MCGRGGMADALVLETNVNRRAGSSPAARTTKKTTFVYQTNVVFFELSVPCGTIRTPSVREVMLRIAKCLRAWVAHLTSLRA